MWTVYLTSTRHFCLVDCLQRIHEDMKVEKKWTSMFAQGPFNIPCASYINTIWADHMDMSNVHPMSNQYSMCTFILVRLLELFKPLSFHGKWFYENNFCLVPVVHVSTFISMKYGNINVHIPTNFNAMCMVFCGKMCLKSF